MALDLADTTGLRSLVGAVSLAMARLATATALAGELALNPLVRALGGVVARFVAVIAQAGVEALLLGLGAVASEVTVAAAAAKRKISRVLKTFLGSGPDSLATATVIASVLRDVLPNVAGVVLETVAAAGSGLLGSPGLVGRETAVAGSHCNGCQL
jgi:hypothetical protein